MNGLIDDIDVLPVWREVIRVEKKKRKKTIKDFFHQAKKE